MARDHADPGDAAGLELAAGDRQPERVRAGRSHRAPVVVGGQEPVERHRLAVALEVLVCQLVAEGGRSRRHCRPQLVGGGAPDLDRHYVPTFSRGA
jgi:hypothetical protein